MHGVVPSEKNATGAAPQRSRFSLLNYWRAVCLLQQTPFADLWHAAKKEAPGLLAVFVVATVCVVSVLFTIGWCIKQIVTLAWRTIYCLISMVRR